VVGFEPTTHSLHLSLCYHWGWTISSPTGGARRFVPLNGTTPKKDSLYTFPRFFKNRGLARDYPELVEGLPRIHLVFPFRITAKGCVTPPSSSLWQFAHTRIHLSNSSFVFSQDLVYPLSPMPKDF